MPPHHHGNLRSALIEAGLALLAAGEPLTLRAAAARAGVSHAAPAHHFAGLPGLLTAIACRAFDDFSAQMITARSAAANTPTAQLHGICAGYIAFAQGNAKLFDLMFTSPDVCRDDPDLRAAGENAYGILRAACAPFAADAASASIVEMAVWSMVHGFASLHRGPAHTSNTPHPPPFDPAPDFASLLAKLLP